MFFHSSRIEPAGTSPLSSLTPFFQHLRLKTDVLHGKLPYTHTHDAHDARNAHDAHTAQL